MSERDQHNRWRCTVVGCNPVMKSLEATEKHRAETGHRTAKWPIRSAAGKAKARQRNKTGYYDKYNVGAKSAEARALEEFAQAQDSWCEQGRAEQVISRAAMREALRARAAEIRGNHGDD